VCGDDEYELFYFNIGHGNGKLMSPLTLTVPTMLTTKTIFIMFHAEGFNN